MQDKAIYIFSLLALLVVAACNTTGSNQYGAVTKDMQSFQQYLQSGYKQLAEYERHWDQDEEAAIHFEEKSKKARYGKAPGIDRPDDLSVSSKIRDKMVAGRIMLVDATENLNTKENARYLAEAQTNYDCWLEREKDKADNSNACKDLFYRALKELQIPDQNRRSVYFASNEAVLDEGAVTVVKHAAEQFVGNDLWRIRLVGRTDSKGDYEANVILSMRRAIAVRNSLAQHGVDPDKVLIEAVGAVDKNLSGEEFDESKARRVDLFIAPVYIAFDQKGPDIHEILPHFFSAQGSDW